MSYNIKDLRNNNSQLVYISEDEIDWFLYANSLYLKIDAPQDGNVKCFSFDNDEIGYFDENTKVLPVEVELNIVKDKNIIV